MAELFVWQFSDLTTTGPDPFPASNAQNNSAVGASTITINSGSSRIALSVTDNDTSFNNTDSSQDLTTSVVLNGTTYAAGTNIVPDYSYILRPAGSSDPADNITIYVIKLGGVSGDHEAIVSDSRMIEGVTYEVVGLPSFPDSPTVAYSSLYVCFAKGTWIRTEAGPRPVETLAPGDRIVTEDGGLSPILWIGRRILDLRGLKPHQRPVRFDRGSLGRGVPFEPLVVSPQHRMRVLLDPEAASEVGCDQDVLVPALACVRLPGVRHMQGLRRIEYFSILLPEHSVIFANGALAESLYPGPEAMKILPPEQRADILKLFPRLSTDVHQGYGPLAKPVLVRRLAEQVLRQSFRARMPRAVHLPSRILKNSQAQRQLMAGGE